MAFIKVSPSAGKFEAKSVNSIFVGYTATSKNYRIYVAGKQTIKVMRDVVFVETLSFIDRNDTEDQPLVKITGLRVVFDQVHEIDLSQEPDVEQQDLDRAEVYVERLLSYRESATQDENTLSEE